MAVEMEIKSLPGRLTKVDHCWGRELCSLRISGPLSVKYLRETPKLLAGPMLIDYSKYCHVIKCSCILPAERATFGGHSGRSHLFGRSSREVVRFSIPNDKCKSCANDLIFFTFRNGSTAAFRRREIPGRQCDVWRLLR